MICQAKFYALISDIYQIRQGAVLKRRPQSRGRECLSSADILRTRGRGFFRCGRLHFLV